MFVDSDDTIPTDCIQSLMGCAIKNKADIVIGNIMGVYENGVSVLQSCYEYRKIENPIMERCNGYVWGKVYKSELFSNLKFPEEYWFEDSVVANILYKICKRCYTIPQCVYEYFQNMNGISRSCETKIKSIDSIYIIKKLLEDKKNFGIDNDIYDYEYFLRMVLLTFKRTMVLPKEVRRNIFVIQCFLKHQYYRNYVTDSQYRNIEYALNTRNYRKYLLECGLKPLVNDLLIKIGVCKD